MKKHLLLLISLTLMLSLYGQSFMTTSNVKVEINSDQLDHSSQLITPDPKTQPKNTQTVTIGDGDQNARYPMDFFWKTSLFQTLYYPDELGLTSDRITALEFYNNFPEALNGKPTKIWLGSTNLADLSGGYIPATQLTLVYDGTVDYPAGENAISITLLTPYLHTQGNLVLLVQRPMDTSYFSSASHFKCQTIGTNRARYYRSDSTEVDPNNPPAGTLTGQFPKTKITYTGQPIVNDLGVVSIAGNLFPCLGVASNYTVRIRNNGIADQNDYTVRLMGPDNVELASVAGPPIGSTQILDVVIPWTPTTLGHATVYGKVEMNGDELDYNNQTNTIELYVQPESSQAVTIGIGKNHQLEPFNANYGYGRSLGFYAFDQIGKFGAIHSLGWSVAGSSGANIPYKVYVKPTDDMELRTVTWDEFTSTATLVKQGSHIFDHTGWHVFELDTPIYYNGGHLLIGVEANYGGYGAASTPSFHYSANASNTHLYWHQHTNPPTNRGTPTAYLPNLLMMLLPLSDIPMPALYPSEWNYGRLQVNTSKEKSFSILNAGSETLIITGISPMPGGFFEIIESPTFPLQLDYGQSASFTIQYAPTVVGNHMTTVTVNAGNITKELVVSGECYDPVIYNFPYIESFEVGQTDGAQVKEWTQHLDNGKTQYWVANSSYNSYNRSPRTGSFNATLQWNGDAWLMRPFSLQAGQSYDVEVWARTDINAGFVGLYYGVGDSLDAMTNTIKEQTMVFSGNYQRIKGSFTPDSSGVYWISIHGVGTGTYSNYRSYLSIDDFKILHTPSAAVFTHTPGAIDFGPVHINTANTQYIEVINTGVGTLGLTEADVNIIGSDAAMFEITNYDLPFTLTSDQSGIIPIRYNPIAAGTHNATLRMVYEGENYDVNLSGQALNMDVLCESFEGNQFPPHGWLGEWIKVSRSTHGSYSAYKAGSSTAQYLLSTPLLTVEEDSSLSFCALSTDQNGILQVVYSQDRVNWIQLGNDITFPDSFDWFEYTVELSPLSGGDYYFGLRTGLVSASYYADMFVGPKVTPLGTNTITIGDGNASSGFFPIFGNYNYTYTQQIYTKGQINQNGEISKIRFFYMDGDISSNGDWTIYMGHTRKMSFASNTNWEILPNLTKVFSGSVINILPGHNNWMEITLQTPFVYNNLDNLLIAVHQSTHGAASMSWGAFDSGANTGICYYANSINPNPSFPPTAGFRSSAINRIQLDFHSPTVPKPPMLVSPENGAQVIVGQPISLSWTLDAGSACASGYDVYIDGILVSENQPGTSYTTIAQDVHSWYVVAHNNMGSSAPSETRTFNIADAVYIGAGTANQYYPFLAYYRYGRSLGLYTAEQVGQFGVINTLGWSVATARNNTIPYKIYALVTNDSELDLMSWNEFTSSATLVKQGTHTFDSVGWHIFTLDTPIYYTHGNLLIGVESNYGEGGTGSESYFHYTNSDTSSHQYWIDYYTPPTGSGHMSTCLPNLFLMISPLSDDPTVLNYPWSENFDSTATEQMPDNWTIISSHSGADERSWKAASDVGASSEPHAAVVYNHDLYAKNEWMISVPFLMQVGQAYEVSFKVRGENEALALHWGTAPNNAYMCSNEALYDKSQINYANWTEERVVFIPPSTGVYYFGWHAYTPIGGGSLAVDDISISLVPEVDLAATSLCGPSFSRVGSSTDLQVSVKNLGTNPQANYTIYLKEHGTDVVLAQELIIDSISPNETKAHTISWTPSIQGNVAVYAEAFTVGDMNRPNNTTSAEQMLIYPASMEFLYVGDPASALVSASLPFNLYYEDFVAETVYLASEIQATGGVIHALAYYNNFPTAQSIPAQIWMKNTDAANLSEGWLPWEGYQLVFDGIIECPEGFNEILIPITHFNYTGGNLAIRTSKTWEDKWVANHHWLLTRDRVHPNRTRVYQTDIQNLDHTNPPTGNLIDYLPNVTFFMEIVDIVSAPVVSISALESNIVLNWGSVPGAANYKVYASEDPYNFGPDPIATVETNSFTLPTTAARHFFKVTSIGGRALGRRGAVSDKLAPRDFIVIDTELEAERNGIEKAKGGFKKRP